MSAPAMGTVYTLSNSLEEKKGGSNGAKGCMRVREKERERARMDAIGRGKLKARKRVWLHYTG